MNYLNSYTSARESICVGISWYEVEVWTASEARVGEAESGREISSTNPVQ